MNVPEISVIITDDHQIFIEGLKVVLKKAEEICCTVVGEANTGSSLLKLLTRVEADLLLLDMSLPDMDGLEVLAQLKAQKSAMRVIVLSMYDEPKIIKAAFKAGVDGYLLKGNNIPELYKAIKTVMTGETFLSGGLSLSHGISMHSRFMQEGRLTVSFDDRFLRKFNLTKRELEVFKLIGKAMNNKDISRELYISDQTVGVHRKNLMRKLGVGTTPGLIKIAFENNLM